MTLRLDGRAVWVTGASRGLGRAIALACAQAGAELLLTARSAEALADTANAVRAAGGRAVTLVGDVTDDGHVAEAVALADATWGRLDVLINNAGISPAFDRAERLALADFERTLAVNLTAALRTCQAALALLRAAPAASVINVSSIHGDAAHERLLAYSTSKAGLDMLTRTLALEWARDGIRVNGLAPGYVETDMTASLQASERHHAALLERIPLGRFARPDEIVGAALFLAGDASAYMTGATLVVDGGWSAR